MATPEALAALARGELWPGVDRRRWKTLDLFEMGFCKRPPSPTRSASASPTTAAAERAAADLAKARPSPSPPPPSLQAEQAKAGEPRAQHRQYSRGCESR